VYEPTSTPWLSSHHYVRRVVLQNASSATHRIGDARGKEWAQRWGGDTSPKLVKVTCSWCNTRTWGILQFLAHRATVLKSTHTVKAVVQTLSSNLFCTVTQTGCVKTKLSGFSPQANYTDRATAACRRSYWQLLQIECVTWSAQRIPMAVNLGFLDPKPLVFHSSSSSVIPARLSGPRSRLTTPQKIWQRRESNLGRLTIRPQRRSQVVNSYGD
jgi:hypothetical protein